MFKQEGLRLRIYLNEGNRLGGIPLHEWLIREAQLQELAGATLVRGIEGFGQHRHTHSARVLDIAVELPLILEFVDTPAKIERFVSSISSSVNDGMMTLETVWLKLCG